MEQYLNSYNNNNTSNLKQIEDTISLKSQISEIKKYVNHNHHKKDFDEKVRQQFSHFENKYPALFKKLTNQDCDAEQLEFVLNRLEQVRTGIKSQHDASVEVGQVLVDKYVKPELEKKNNN